MELSEKSAAWIEEYGILPDPQERFSYALEQSTADAGLAVEERREEDLVTGCLSRVWIVGEAREGRWFFRSDADAPMVKAMAWLLCEFYSGARAEVIAAQDPDFLGELRLLDALTENRRRGVRHMVARIRSLAGEG